MSGAWIDKESMDVHRFRRPIILDMDSSEPDQIW